MKILAIETSCDDTSAAVVEDGRVLSNVVRSQDEVHRPYGGVVPELASRSHIRTLLPIVHSALERAGVELPQIDAVAATVGPGLVGSLLVGLNTAKGIAFAQRRPFLGVNHLEGHVLSILLERELSFPYIALLVSGGHTALYLAERLHSYRLLGATRDDAAGEAFDKVAKVMGLGFPGGRVIDELSRRGNPEAIPFPRARLKSTRGDRRWDFSFSGIKTAVAQYVQERGSLSEAETADVAASFQEAVVEMLLEHTFAALEECGVSRLAIVGGVSANSRLRTRASEMAAARGVELAVPPLRFCTDNAAMIGYAAWTRLVRGECGDWSANAQPNLEL